MYTLLHHIPLLNAVKGVSTYFWALGLHLVRVSDINATYVLLAVLQLHFRCSNLLQERKSELKTHMNTDGLSQRARPREHYPWCKLLTMISKRIYKRASPHFC